MDVLSLIATHLPSQKDNFRASFVCRHWRRTFLHRAELWSHLFLSKGEVYVQTLLKRAKGSPLTILASGIDPPSTTVLLPFYTNQIAGLELTNSNWEDIRLFSRVVSTPLPLLHTLTINVVTDGSDAVTPLPYPLFSGAVGLKELRLHSVGSPRLSHFVFPNLTSFELSVASPEGFRGSQLLDFLEALPMLRTVHMKIIAVISLEDIPQEKVVVLHNVESFFLVASNGVPSYKLAAHISCPSVKDTSLTYSYQKRHYLYPRREQFPPSDALKAIIRQYTTSPIEEVTFEMDRNSDCFIACYLTFRSADTTVIRLNFETAEGNDDGDPDISETFNLDVFCKASGVIRSLPLPANVKRLHIYDLLDIDKEAFTQIGNEFGRLLKSLGPLEELTISGCEMEPFFLPFVHYPKIVGYPPIRVLTLIDPWYRFDEGVAMGLVNLAKAQHELGVPLERVSTRLLDSDGIEEELKPWVGAVDYALYDFNGAG